jgi:peptidylprolyl isomerase
MRARALATAALLAALLAPAIAQDAPAAPTDPSRMTTGELIAAAPPEAWEPIDPADLVVMYIEATPGAAPGRVVIRLAPAFAPAHTAAMTALLRQGFFDGRAVVRSQENYVAQWGDGEAAAALGLPGAAMPAEFDRPLRGLSPMRLPEGDVMAPQVGWVGGFPMAWDPRRGRAWLIHCNGMVGAGRGEGADSGGPAELYAVNGHAPRALDRNVTLMGRVIAGMEHLSVLPRGTEALGFYGPSQVRPVIRRAVLAADLPEGERPRFEALRTDGDWFGELVESRRNRRDGWTLHRHDRIEICQVPLPVRPALPR